MPSNENNISISNADELLNFAINHRGTVSDVSITPEVAAFILELNTENRKMKPTVVTRLASIITGGRWINTGEPIIISENGQVNDGQHRLAAIIEANQPAVVDIRFGVSRAAMAATNTGVPRYGHDLMVLRGEQYAAALAATLRFVTLWNQGRITRYTLAVDNVLLEQTLANHPDVREATAMMSRKHVRGTKQSWFAFCLWLFMQHWPIETVQAFSDQVATGEGYSGDPARELYRRLDTVWGMSGRRVEVIDKIIITIKAWNAYVEHRRIGTLRVDLHNRTSDGFPALSPIGRIK